MGGSGQAANGFVPMGQASGGGFLSGIPWWAYVIVMVLGLAISVFCLVRHNMARRRAMAPPMPGSPPPLGGASAPGGGNGLLIAAVGATLLLVLAPLVLMLVMKPWNSNWLVGRWSENPGCMGETVEFTSDGFAIARGDRKPYRLEGDRIIVNGQTETIQHDGDHFTVRGETFTRCSGTGSSVAAGNAPPFGPPSPSTPPAMPSAPASPVPEDATWVVGRWSRDGDCSTAMDFRADGTATTSSGQPATFRVTPIGEGASVGITVDSGGQRLVGEMEATGPSDAVLRASQPSVETLNLHRC